jgi:hypothetical protein
MQEDMFKLGKKNPLQVNIKNVLERNNETKQMWMERWYFSKECLPKEIRPNHLGPLHHMAPQRPQIFLEKNIRDIWKLGGWSQWLPSTYQRRGCNKKRNLESQSPWIFATIIKLFITTTTSLNNLTLRKQNEYVIYTFYLLKILVYSIGHKGSVLFDFFLMKPARCLCGDFSNYWRVSLSLMELLIIELDLNIS